MLKEKLKEKEKLKKLKEKEKLKKLKEKEKLKKLKEKEKLKKLKEKEKIKKLKEKEKLRKLKQKEKIKKYKKNKIGGGMTTREMKSRILKILNSWEREDDADDYFQMWADTLKISSESGIDGKIKNKLFSILNYNMLTEMQKLKDLFYSSKKNIFRLNLSQIIQELENYDFLKLLAETINKFDEDSDIEISDLDKKKLFIGIIENLIHNIALLTENIFNTVVFPNIGKIQLGNNIKLYRSWRRKEQLELMKSQNNFQDEVGSILITDNYLSASLEKDLALQFYSNSSSGIPEFILWEIDIPETYPYLKVSDYLKEILIHIGAILEYNGFKYEKWTDNRDRTFDYKIEQYKWVGFDINKTNNVIETYKKILNNIKTYQVL